MRKPFSASSQVLTQDTTSYVRIKDSLASARAQPRLNLITLDTYNHVAFGPQQVVVIKLDDIVLLGHLAIAKFD